MKADIVNSSADNLRFLARSELVPHKWMCFGFDNPYLLIERARLLSKEQESKEQFKERSK